MSGVNVNQSELVQHITACNNALKQLSDKKQELEMAGVNPFEFPIRNQIARVIDVCNQINVNDVQKIEKRESWVLGASVVGGVAAGAGVVTSASANSDKLNDKQKEKKLNKASNVLGGVSTAGSLVATGFNISLLTLTNNMIDAASQCEQELAND